MEIFRVEYRIGDGELKTTEVESPSMMGALNYVQAIINLGVIISITRVTN